MKVELEKSSLFLHGVCMLRECIYGKVCTRAARKENPIPNPNPNSHDQCLLSKWKCRMYAHTHLFCATSQKPRRKRVHRKVTERCWGCGGVSK